MPWALNNSTIKSTSRRLIRVNRMADFDVVNRGTHAGFIGQFRTNTRAYTGNRKRAHKTGTLHRNPKIPVFREKKTAEIAALSANNSAIYAGQLANFAAIIHADLHSQHS